MKDFFGNDYVKSSWFDQYFGWLIHSQTRVPVIRGWIINTIARLREMGHDPQVAWNDSQLSGWTIKSEWAVLHLPKIGHKLGILLSANHYDTLTKEVIDPAGWVIARATGQKWVEDHTEG